MVRAQPSTAMSWVAAKKFNIKNRKVKRATLGSSSAPSPPNQESTCKVKIFQIYIINKLIKTKFQKYYPYVNHWNWYFGDNV